MPKQVKQSNARLYCAQLLLQEWFKNFCLAAKFQFKKRIEITITILQAYKLDAADTSETYYYAKRGCAADPLDGVDTGEQAQADAFVFPAGYTDIKQSNQRTTTAKGNTLR